MRFDAGMKAQLRLLSRRLAEGMPRRGWKIGINVPEMQKKIGLTHPLVGWIDGEQVMPSGAVVRYPASSRLHVEPEVCIRLSCRVRPRLSPEAARAAIAGVAPAIEVVDYGKPSASLDEVIAHSMFHVATILGSESELLGPTLGADIADWLTFEVSGRKSEPPRRDLVPTDLGKIVAFAAGFLEPFGESLRPDDLILSGSFTTPAMRLRKGEEAIGRFGPLGDVRVIGGA